MPEVSVIIPAYNAAKYLEETVRSVRSQTLTDWELIIIDDGSTDNTRELVQPLLQDPRIKYFFQQNAGVSAARNKGMGYASGRFIALLDADDVWPAENLQKKISLMTEDGSVDFVFSDMLTFNNSFTGELLEAPPGTDSDMVEKILLWEGEVIPCPCSNLVFRKQCFDAGVRFDPELSTAADQYFCLCISKSFRGKRIPEPLFYYRVLPNSMSRNIRLMERDHIRAYRKASQKHFFRSFWFRKRCFSNLYLILAGSWWRNGHHKPRGLYFIFRGLFAYPPNIALLLKKIFS
jgi:glycosyltransferase involved in cell wall biosynthesis